MNWFRSWLAHVFSTLLLLCLLGTAIGTGLYIDFHQPQHLEKWLSQSNLYTNLVDNQLQTLPKSVSISVYGQQVNLPVDSNKVQQAAHQAFSPQVVQTNVNSFLDSNYAWLEGKTSQPNFRLDLSGAKNAFASNVGQDVQDQLSNLPRCNYSQLLQIAADPQLAKKANCLLPGVSAQTAAQQTTKQVATSNDFLGNPVVTPASASLSGTSSTNSQPYYRTLSWLPSAYRLSSWLPWILAIVALVSSGLIIVLTPSRRLGVRRVARALLVSGIILIILKLVSSLLFNAAIPPLLRKLHSSLIQQSLTDVARRATSSLTTIDLWFGLGFAIVGAGVYIFLRTVRRAEQPQEPININQPNNSSTAL